MMTVAILMTQSCWTCSGRIMKQDETHPSVIPYCMITHYYVITMVTVTWTTAWITWCTGLIPAVRWPNIKPSNPWVIKCLPCYIWILIKADHINTTNLYTIDDISSYFTRLKNTRSCCNLIGYFRLQHKLYLILNDRVTYSVGNLPL